jgi:hypothetical protein
MSDAPDTETARLSRDARAPLSLAWLGLALVGTFIVLGLVMWRLHPPTPERSDAPDGEFSAGRAMVVLRALAGDGLPHPLGSLAHEAMRARVAGHLTELGYDVNVRHGFVCGIDRPVCGVVSNIVSRLPGRTAGRAVLLAAHYDSVAAGPGIADDLSNVAALLEIARALKASPRLQDPVIFLIDDGEEDGLLGAAAFVSEDPWAKDVGAVVNLEARGTRGPSLMFETSEENGWLIKAYARSVPRPAALSLTYDVYKHLPNDTDFTVFKRSGLSGLNFAFIAEVADYHTPLDNLAHLDPGTLQHQGESAFAVTKALANMDLSHPPAGRSCYQDVLGFVVLRWPTGAALPLTLAAALLLVAVASDLVRRRKTTVTGILYGLAAFAGVFLAVAASGFLLTRLIQALAGAGAPWSAHPLPTRVALWGVALAAGGAVATAAARRAGFLALLAGTWLGWSALAVALASVAPGTGTMVTIPLLAAALLLAATRSPAISDSTHVQAAICCVLVMITAAIWLPLAFLLEWAIGLGWGIAVTLPLAMVVTAVAPLFAVEQRGRRLLVRSLTAVASVALAAAAVAVSTPPYSVERPQRLNIVHLDDRDEGTSVWVAGNERGGIPAELRAAAAFRATAERPYPWSAQKQFLAAAAPLDQPAPQLRVTKVTALPEGRKVEATLRSLRGAPDLYLLISRDAPLRSMTAGGKPVVFGPGAARRLGRYRVVRFCGIPDEGVDLALDLAGGSPVEVLVVDQSRGLPSGGEALLAARPATAVPSDAGDTTLVLGRAKL